MATTNDVSTLLAYLPAVFQSDRKDRDHTFLGRFLLAFEELLLGLEGSEIQGLEARIAGIARTFRPMLVTGDDASPGETPKEFLDWLAGWVALTLREDWSEDRQRELIAKAMHLYRLRGTKQGLREYIQVYTQLTADVDDYGTPFQLGVHSSVGIDTYLGGWPWPAFHFRVHVPVKPRPDLVAAARVMVPTIIELQKPAHTDYEFTLEPLIFQLEVHSQIDEDTLLG